jgi:phosphomannomutase
MGEREETMTFVADAFSDLPCVTVDGIRARFAGDDWEGWFLCRPSNTEPILVMRAEATTEAGLQTIKDEVERRLGERIELDRFHNG